MAELTAAALENLICHGLDLSYFTGKIEAFLRYKEIPHTRAELDTRAFRRVARATGLAQMPALELRDGRWLTDSTAIIEAIDPVWPGGPVLPECPLQLFFSQLLEDYADEWLWRPALHYRWSFQPDARLMSHRIAAEMLRDVPLPLALRRTLILSRQRRKYVTGDGITPATSSHVESIYARNLAFLQTMLRSRPFLLGARPTLADFGFFASMFRHFGIDPTPARLMRDTAPAVYEWLARLWNARASTTHGALPPQGTIPADWMPVLADMATNYVPYLAANAAAHASGAAAFSVTIETTTYRLPVHRFRVACLERLQRLLATLPTATREAADPILRETGLAALAALPPARSGYDPTGAAPFLTPQTAWSRK